MRSAAFVVSLLVLSALAPGCRGDREKCAAAAQHFAELVYWEGANAEIAALPPERREAARKQKLLAFNQELDAQLQLRISQCVGANADGQADCINASKTAAEALKCAEIAKGPKDSQSGCCEAGGAPATSSALAALLGLVLLRRRRARA
jgi:uncharacterized protein (TIGR03382 family)